MNAKNANKTPLTDKLDTQSLGYTLPPVGDDPGAEPTATTPGSFANKPKIAPGPGGSLTFSSPDTPGMPAPSKKTAWDFMPPDWTLVSVADRDSHADFVEVLGHHQPCAWRAPAAWWPAWSR